MNNSISWNILDTKTGELTEVRAVIMDGIDRKGNYICYLDKMKEGKCSSRSYISYESYIRICNEYLDETVQIEMTPFSNIGNK